MNTENNYQETDLGNVSPNPRGAYSDTIEYEYLDLVEYQGGSYLCLAEIVGTAPEPGQTTTYWQVLTLPGSLTQEYIAMHDQVKNLSEQVAAEAEEVREAQENITLMEANVQTLQSQTAESAQAAETSKTQASGHASAAEQSSIKAKESEANASALVNGFDAHVTEKTEEAKENITQARQTAVGAITTQQTQSIQAVKDQTEEYIAGKQADALTAIKNKANEYATSVNQDIQAVNDAAATQASNIKTAGASQIEAVNNAGTTQVSNVEAAGQAQVVNVQTEGAAQVQNVQEAAAEIIADRDQIESNRQAILNTAIKRTASGKTILVSDSAKVPFLGLRQYGKTEQFTTTGAQLLPFVIPGNTGTMNGMRYVVLDDNKGMRITGTPNSEYTVIAIAVLSLSPGTYYVGKERSGANKVGLQINVTRSDGTMKYYSDTSFVIDGTETLIRAQIQTGNGTTMDTAIDQTIYPILSKDAPTEYEPYTGGIPSPNLDYPQELVSVGDKGSITTTITDGAEDTQTLIMQTPNGLRGIPVSSGGNYTDETGQQWIADYRDWGRGVDVQRVAKYTFDGSEAWDYQTDATSPFLYKTLNDAGSKNNALLCNYAIATGMWETTQVSYIGAFKRFMVNIEHFGLETAPSSASTFKNLVSEYNANGKPLIIQYVLETPIETPIPAEELAAYRTLHTNYPYTTIVNDEGCWMEMEYATGIEDCIDTKVQEGNIMTDSVTEKKYILGMKDGLLTVFEVIE
ncbi:MAG: hypothetical protein Q4F15_06260 [Bacillota bacterium]|nr:hypothetical protein [Bacillota bacterium]